MLWKKQQQKSNKRCSEFRGVFFSPFSLLCTFASLKSACYYAMCPFSPLWNNFITSGKHSEYMLRKMILRRPWASDWTSASPTEARGLFGKGLFLVISAYCYRKEEPKMGIGYGALESLSQCIQALAGTVELRGCCAETWNAESRICQKLTSEAGAGFTWATTVCGEYDEEKNVVAKASCWYQKLATQSHMIQTSHYQAYVWHIIYYSQYFEKPVTLNSSIPLLTIGIFLFLCWVSGLLNTYTSCQVRISEDIW